MEDITLEKIDLIRQRTGIGYAAAKEILEKNNGNVVDSLIYIEQNQKTFAQNVTETSNELVETVKDIVKKGNVNRIKIKRENKVLIDIPVTAGIVTGALTLFYPSLLVIGALTAILSKISIEVERPNGEIEVINDIVKEKVGDVKQKAEDLVNNVKDDIMQKKDEFTGNKGGDNSNGNAGE